MKKPCKPWWTATIYDQSRDSLIKLDVSHGVHMSANGLQQALLAHMSNMSILSVEELLCA